MKKEFGPTAYWIGLFVLIGFHAWLFNLFGISPRDFLLFLLGLLVLAYIPGQAVCWLARIKASRLEMLNLAMVVGMVLSTVLYKFARLLGMLELFAAWLILAFCFFVWTKLKRPPQKADFTFRITPTGIVFGGIIVLLLLSLFVDNYRNGLEQPDGSMLINSHYYDGFIRNPIVRELSHSVPPQMPFASGFPLGYHYGMDLFLSIFYRHLGLGVLDLIHRLSLTWFFLLFITSMFIFVKELSSSRGAALLAAFLAVFGSGGFAYIATYLLGIYQWGNIFYSFYFFNFAGINSILPAFAVLGMGFFALSRALKTKQPGWIWITALLLALALEFKMFLLGPIVGALLLAGGLSLLYQKDRMLLKILLFTLLFAVPLVLLAYLTSRGGPQYAFHLKFVDWVRWSLQALKFTPLQRAWADLVHRSLLTPRSLLAVLPALLVFFVGGMGLNLLAVPAMLKEFFTFRKLAPFRGFLIALFAGSVLYIFCVDMSFQGNSRNLVYVYKLGLVILCAFWAERIFIWVKSKPRTVITLAILVVVGLSVPNTIRFLWIRSETPNPMVFPATFMQTCGWINQNTGPEGTFIHPVDIKHACYFMDRRVVLDNTGSSFLGWHLTSTQLERRRKDVSRYFSDLGLNSDVLDRYEVAYVWSYQQALSSSPRNSQGWIDGYIDLGTKQPRKAKHSHLLEPLWSNGEYMVLKVHFLPETQREVFIFEEHNGSRVFKKFRAGSKEFVD